MPLAGLALALILVGVSAAPAGLPQAIVHDPIVAAILSQVTTPTLAHELAGLTGERPVTVAGISYTIATRHSYHTEPISTATRYAYEQLAACGLAVAYHHYTWTDASGQHNLRNVIAEEPGLVDPDEIYLITAHIDDMPNSATAPGADDNGSGAVAVLMAARLLAPHRFSTTIRFVLFTGEEQGLRGSHAYAEAHKGDNIRGVVNLDMIAYNSDTQPIIDLYGSGGVPGSLELTRIFSDVIGVYGLDLIPHRFDVRSGYPIEYSDQWAFLFRGDAAFLAIEDMSDLTPHYHSSNDRLSTLDLDYYAASTRAAIGAIAHLAGLLPGGALSGTVSDLDAGLPLSGALVTAATPAYPYTFTARANSDGGYSLPLPISAYSFTAQASRLGYYPATITGVVLITDTITVRDFVLEPWPHRLYLPMILHDS